MTGRAATREQAREIAAAVVDPELPMLTLADLGVLRDVEVVGGEVLVDLTPTYSGCPALATMRDDLVRRLRDAGFADVRVRVVLAPAWTSDWITPAGRRALAENGISPPGAAVPPCSGPIPLRLELPVRDVRCPRCGAASVLVSEFGTTACRAQYRCRGCGEPFDHVKEI